MKNWNKGGREKTSLIADVDCTAEGKPLCEENGVSGYPTIKWGAVGSLEDYSGGREYDDLKKFAKENLKPMCSPANIDLCDDAKKKEIADFQAMAPADLAAKIEEKKAEMKAAEDTFAADVEKVQATYKQLQTDKDEAVAAVKKSGLGLMQAVEANQKKKKAAEDEF